MLARLSRRTAVLSQSAQSCRAFSVTAQDLSGHNRWSKIKHDKGKNDAAKSKERTVLITNIIRASKDGGPDPQLNGSLQFAIGVAKKAQVSKELIAESILKGQGKSLSGAALENVFIEAVLPHGVAAIIEGQAENKKRVLAAVKSIVQRAGGALSPTAFAFEKIGKVWFKPHETVGVDEIMDEAIEGGAEEIALDDGQLMVDTAPEMVSAIGQKLQTAFGLEVERSAILYSPKEETMTKINDEQAIEVQAVLDQLEEVEDVQDIYVNATV